MASAIPATTGTGTTTAHAPVSDHMPARRFGMRCPHCKTPGDIRTSGEEAPTLRILYFNCRNPACGHTWRASLVYDFGLSPSAIPDPKLDLPLRPVPRSEALRAMADAQIRADASARADPAQPTLFDATIHPQETAPCPNP